jgi:hypothetical protein
MGIASTAVSGLGNVLLQILVAAYTTTPEFGAFALEASTILLVLGFGRLVIAQTDLIRGSSEADSGVSGAAWLFAAFLLAAGLAASGLAVWASWPPIVVAVGVAVAASSVFVLQDTARFRCFRIRRPGLALISDAIVFVLSIAGLTLAGSVGLAGPAAIPVWAGATLVGFAVIAAPIGFTPALREGWRWIRGQRDLMLTGGGEYVLQAGLPYLLNWVLAGLGGLAVLAGYRLAQLLFAAVSNVAQGLNSVSMASIVDSGDPAFARRVIARERAVVIFAAVGVLSVVVLLPEPWGIAAFGSTWREMAAFTLPVAVHSLAIALSVAGFAVLRLLGFARFSLIVRVGTALAIVGLVAVAVPVGAVAVAWALAATTFAATAIREWRLQLELGRLKSSGRRLSMQAPGREVPT